MLMLKRLVSGVIVLLIVVVSGLLFYLGSKDQLTGDLLLPLLAIAGIGCLLLTLILAATIFSKVGLADKTQALGLPEGSVRAVIALGLLVIFAIVSVYLYGSLCQREEGALKMLTVATQVEVDRLQERARGADSNIEIVLVVPTGKSPGPQGAEPPKPQPTEPPKPQPTEPPKPQPTEPLKPQPTEPLKPPGVASESSSGPFQVYYRLRTGRDAAEFAKQLLTLIGTLLTAVASFYFGTRAVTSAMDRTTVLAPVITSVSPATITKAAAGSPAVTSSVTLLGSGLDRVTEVKLSQAGSTPIVGKVETANTNALVCSFQIDSAVATGAWDLEVSGSGGEKAKRSIAVQ